MNYLKQKLEEKTMIIEKPMTETELAIRTGIHRTTLSEYITGTRKLRKMEHIVAIAKVLDLDIKEFIEEILK